MRSIVLKAQGLKKYYTSGENVTKALGINFGESEEKHEQEDYNAGRENERDEDKQK